jgi:mannose-6-phosphate isomerase-like protein (cupin superfamily)
MKHLINTAMIMLVSVSFFGQTYQSLDTIKPPKDFENIYTRTLSSDSLVSTFIIFIRKEVKEHRHLTHAENVLILSGQGIMTVNGKELKVKMGDMIYLPAGTPHSLKVTSEEPVKVLSVQAPYFDGKDRVFSDAPKPK